uniref:Uncharacterized protein n=1 Tax=Arundo donax TaxID=35708 RepID=A0A0A9D0H1_ARUDO
MAPAQVRHLRDARLPAPAAALAACAARRRPPAPLVVRRRRLLRERDAVLLPRLDLDGVRRRRLEHLRERRFGRGGGRAGAGGHLLDVLERLGGVLGLGIGRGDGEVEDGDGRDRTAASAAAGGEEAQKGEEDEEEHEGGADTDADELPQVEPEHQRALRQLRVRHGRGAAQLPGSGRNGGSPRIPSRIAS